VNGCRATTPEWADHGRKTDVSIDPHDHGVDATSGDDRRPQRRRSDRASSRPSRPSLPNEGEPWSCSGPAGGKKSAVYFIATNLLREAGAGPTLLISPLLCPDAQPERDGPNESACTPEASTATTPRSGLRWEEQLRQGLLDLLLVSPERLSNPDFRADPSAAHRVHDRAARSR